MTNRFRALFCCALAIIPQVAEAQFLPTSHSRQGKLPAMITTRADVEKLVQDVIASALPIEATDTVFQGHPMVFIAARTADGRSMSVTTADLSALDSMRRFLGERSELVWLSASFKDARAYRERAVYYNQARVSDVWINMISEVGPVRSNYLVSGYELARVNKIADRIESFGKTFETWRTPELGEMTKTIVKVLALLLLPVALALRERRFSWLLYPASAALFIASFVVPFPSLFSNLVIRG